MTTRALLAIERRTASRVRVEIECIQRQLVHRSAAALATEVVAIRAALKAKPSIPLFMVFVLNQSPR
jgi:hypothetical protein